MDVLPVVVSGIASGSAYALLALGIVIIFQSTDTVNFAIGDMGTAGAFIALTAIAAGYPIIVGLGIAIASAAILGMLTQRLLIHPLGHGKQVVFISLVMTIGVSLVLQASMGALWGANPRKFPALLEGTVLLAGIPIAWNKIVATGIAATMMVLVGWFFAFTPLGVAMRASAEDPFAARMLGLKSRRIALLAWCLGCGLSAVGIFFLASDISLNTSMADQPLFRAFAGVFLGGLSSMPGAVIGGFCIGILDNVAGRYLSADFRDTIVFAVIIAVLFLRPAGFLGVIRKERV